jgi:pyruvate,water dikinase
MEAAALVVEQGGMLSHAAVLARELHIPAVVGLPGIVDLLSAAPCAVEIDGDAGTVTVLPVPPEGARRER